jgi:tetratricopeptide (TPR) repeat protein
MRHEPYVYDAFILYAHEDREWVFNYLLPALEGAGLRVAIDVHDFDIGVPSIVNLENVISKSRVTLVVMTPDWVNSEWTTFESVLVQSYDPVARARRILPILLKPCRPPTTLAMLTHLDFTDPLRANSQLMRLISTVRGQATMDPREEARLLAGLGDSYAAKDDLEQAIAYYEQSLSTFGSNDSPKSQAEVNIKLARSYKRLASGSTGENLRRAAEYYRRALAMSADVSSAEQVRLLEDELLRVQTSLALHEFFALWEDAPRSDIDTRVTSFMGLFARVTGLPINRKQIPESRGRLVFVLNLYSILGEIAQPTAEVPIIVIGRSTLERSDSDFLRVLMVSELGQRTRIALVILLGKNQEIVCAQEVLDANLRISHAYDVICLGQNEIRQILDNEKPQIALRRLILTHVNLLSVSPYNTTGPTPDHIFFGREVELREIVDHVANSSYAIIGGRRIGKSSLLGCLQRARLPEAGFRTLYHDCSTTPTYEAFLGTPIHDWRPEPPLDPPGTFEDLLQSPPRDKSLVLLLDEADKLTPLDPSAAAGMRPLLNALRALSNKGHMQFVFAGERALRDAMRDSASPLFNFANETILGPLSFCAVEELVTRPMEQLEIELTDTTTIVRRIYDFSSGHPNVVQRLCRRLIERLNEQSTRCITVDDVTAIINSPKFQEEDFLGTYWERATPLERIISLLLAQDSRPYRLQAVLDLLVTHNLRPEPEVVKAALDRLVDLRSILRRTQGGYEFAVTAFPQVIANTTTAEDLLIVLKSQYLKNPMELPE